MSCDSERTAEICRRVGERDDFDFIFLDDFAIGWVRHAQWDAGKAIRPRSRASVEFVSSGGMSGAVEPRWPEAVGDTVEDGTILWTAQAVSYSSLSRRIDEAAWDAPDGITVDEDTHVDGAGMQSVRAWVRGDVAGQFTAVCTVTDTIGGVHICHLVVNVS